MAGNTKKKTASRSPARKTAAKKPTRQTAKSSKTVKTEKPRESRFATQYAPYLMIVIAILVGVCLFAGDDIGVVGGFMKKFFLGMNGFVAYALPVFILVPIVSASVDSNGTLRGKVISFTTLYACISALFHIFDGGADTFSLAVHYKAGANGNGGGAVGGFIGHLLRTCFGKAGTVVILIAVMFVAVLSVFGITPRGLWILIRYKLKVSHEKAEERRAEKYEQSQKEAEERERYLREKRLQREREEQLKIVDPPVSVTDKAEPQKFRFKKKKKFDTDVPIDGEDVSAVPAEEEKPAETQEQIDERLFDEAMRRTKTRMAKEENGKTDAPAENTDDSQKGKYDEIISAVNSEVASDVVTENVDLKKIFVNPEDADLFDKLSAAYLTDGESSGELNISREPVAETKPATPPAPEKKEYVFPPIGLLTEDTERRDDNIRDELHDNAVKLVETLRSFNVKAKIENVSRGPTITRYELMPEAGTRVRSITNLVDDIALSLATTGIRVEAPIPGKAAVGIEVPNKKSSTVHLRTLLEDPKFTGSQSKLQCALGEDVGGDPVFLDVAKMPHLLVAGATGMGKSVCINSLIVSILYNAKPDEVKLILIDPKQVEFTIYNGIPHLLVPVVSEAKKAAGSLSWAVSEMERRFGLIGSVGVRDVNSYNKITKKDPEYEYLPYIVIIIDELADLMMTAPDDVEDSICRLMQKGRAAGMHIIIGTQRPSVDVITGLIKANIPSRIACKVASQVDSRTIIDRAGAEALVGRGDMLFAPVGAPKPIRVQGSYVSEEDVEKVVTFIKAKNSEADVTYSDEVMEQIEREAERCGMGKKGAPSGGAEAGGGDEDPMLKQALELAVNSGKISTSLIQRRLSLGYGRAAKLIDRMEQLGYVSAPEGQKPREVLITKEQYMEMVLKREDELL